MKKFICIILCVSMILSSAVVSSFADNKENNIEEQINEMIDAAEYQDGSVLALVKKESKDYEDSLRLSFGFDNLLDSAEILMDIPGEFVEEETNAGGEDANTGAAEDGYELVLVKSEYLSTKSMLRELLNDGRVVFAEPDYIISLDEEPSVTRKQDTNGHKAADWIVSNEWALSQSTRYMYKNQWANIKESYPGSNDGWNSKSYNASAIAVVIDTGIDYIHPDLDDVMYKIPKYIQKKLNCGTYGKNCLTDAVDIADPYDDHGHGTHCAGIIASEWNSFGTSGVANGAKLVAAKGLSAEGSGSMHDLLNCFIFAYDLAKELDGSKNPVKVVSYSIGGSGLRSLSINLVCEQLATMGIVVCKASGNDADNMDYVGTDSTRFSQSENVILVDAAEYDEEDTDVNQDGKLIRAPFTNYGYTTDVFAPGVKILSTLPVTSNDTLVPTNDLLKGIKLYRVVDGPEEEFKNVKLSQFTDNTGNVYAFRAYAKLTTKQYYALKKANFISFDVEGLYGFTNDDRFYFIEGYLGDTITTSWCGYRVYPTLTGLFDFDDFKTKVGEPKDGYYILPFTVALQLDVSSYEDVKDVEISISNLGFSKMSYPYGYYNGTSMATPYVSGCTLVMYDRLLKSGQIANKKGTDRTEEAIALANAIKGSVSYDKDFDSYSAQHGYVDLTVKEKDFAPVINSITQNGEFIRISGSYFGQERGNVNLLDFSGKETALRVISWTDSSIVVKTSALGLNKSDLYVLTVCKQNNKRSTNLVQLIFNDAVLFEKDCNLNDDLYTYTSGYDIAAAGEKLYILQYCEDDDYLGAIYEYNPKTNTTRDTAYSKNLSKLSICDDSIVCIDDTLYICAQTYIDDEFGYALYECRDGNVTKRNIYGLDSILSSIMALEDAKPYFSLAEIDGHIFMLMNILVPNNGGYDSYTCTIELGKQGNDFTVKSYLKPGIPTYGPSFKSDGHDGYVTNVVYTANGRVRKDGVGHLYYENGSLMLQLITPFEGNGITSVNNVESSSKVAITSSEVLEHRTSNATYGTAVIDGELWISGVYFEDNPEFTHDADTFVLRDGKFYSYSKRVSPSYAFNAKSAAIDGTLYTMFGSVFEQKGGDDVAVYMRATKVVNKSGIDLSPILKLGILAFGAGMIIGTTIIIISRLNQTYTLTK